MDDPKVFSLYRRIEKLKIPVLFHCGEELSGTMRVHSAGERIIRIKKEFPQMKIITAHFGGFRRWDETREFLLGEDVYLDTSYFLDYFSPEEAGKMILAHRPDRLLFGTDFPLIDQAKDLKHIEGLALPARLKEDILFRNAERLLGEDGLDN